MESANRKIRLRQWWLWASTIIITLALTAGVVSFTMGREEAIYPFDLHNTIRGLVALVLLFDFYVIYMQLTIRRAENRLSEGDELLRLTTDNVADMIAVVDAGGRRLYNSPSYEKILGYTSAELAATPALEQVHPEDRPRVAEAAETLRKTGAVQRLEYRFRHKDGTWRILESTGSPLLGARGAAEKFVIVNRDVTELRTHEMQLRQTQKMEAIGRLAGSIAHDFNNLLSVIIGYSDVLEADGLSQGPQAAGDNGDGVPVRKAMEQIRKAAERAAALTRQLLAFSRQQVLQPKVIDVNAAVMNLQDMLSRLIGSNIRMKVELGPELGAVFVDENQLEQVILNLAVNARDAMPSGGQLLIRTDLRTLDGGVSQFGFAAQAGTYVSLTVADSGMGMDAETQSRIFEPFFTTKATGKGTGLGLATVYGIVKQSGGYIDVRSELTKGTTFVVYLPQVKQAVQPSAPRLLNQFAGGPETILVVEDDASVRGLICRMLQQAGYTVLEAESGAAAVEIARRHRAAIHLLLADILMEGLDGRATAKEIRATRRDLRVLYISGYMPFREGEVPGNEIILQKPVTREVLLGKLQEVLNAPQEVPSA